MTPGKAGGLLGERLKGARKTGSRPRRLYSAQPHLVVMVVRPFLLTDICPDHRFIPGLVPGEQVDVLEPDLIVYQLRDGARWVDGEGREAASQGRAAG